MWGKNSANVTDASAASVHGTNPQNLIEKITRSKIYNHAYWKEHCFGLTAESLVDKAMELEYVGGTFGGIREPTTFMQLMLKMLQIQPEKEIIVEFIKNEDYKYVRALGAFYMRLVGRPVEVFQYLEPLYNDYRKIRRRLTEGNYVIVRMDELIDEMLRETFLFDISMPHLPKRSALQAAGQLNGPRRSALEDDLDELEEDLTALESTDNVGAASSRQESGKVPPPPPPPPAATPSSSGKDEKEGRQKRRPRKDEEEAVIEPIEVYESKEPRDDGQHAKKGTSRGQRDRSRERSEERTRDGKRDVSRRRVRKRSYSPSRSPYRHGVGSMRRRRRRYGGRHDEREYHGDRHRRGDRRDERRDERHGDQRTRRDSSRERTGSRRHYSPPRGRRARKSVSRGRSSNSSESSYSSGSSSSPRR